LDVQDLDLRIDQLRHQLDHLPESAELKSLAEERTGLADAVRDLQIRGDDLTREQKKADADVEQVKNRRRRDQERMDQGLVSNPKDLERMQHELVSLDRRISDLEDAELEVMEQVETTQTELAELNDRLAEAERSAASAEQRLDQRSGQITEQMAELRVDRERAADGMPEDLMTLYNKLRAQKGGVGAASLRARRCGGCSLEVNAAELGVIAKAPSDEVLRCEECNPILIRTQESGL
jgi:predicted  nucleic acid-binding Zn-ribbon protein